MEFRIGQYNIIIESEPDLILNKFIQNKRTDPERGGIMLGKIYGDTIKITRLSTPTELDKADRTNFERHKLSAQIVINYEFYNSNGQTVYLGEWHTHPEDHPTPSAQDLKMINSQFRKNQINAPFILLLIQGRKSRYFGFLDNKELISTTF